MKRIQERKILSRLNDLLVILFFISFISDIRPIVGLTTILLAANAFVVHRLESGKWWNPHFLNLFTIGLFLYFAIQAAALLYTVNLREGLDKFQTNLGMIILPVGVLYSSLVNKQSYGKWMKGYIYILFTATLLALVHAAISFVQYHDGSVFFYHSLVSLYSKHAIQFSIIVFIGILFLMEEYSRPLFFKDKTRIVFGIIYFSIFLFLLSSKLVIIIYFFYLLYTIVFTEIFIRQRVYRFAGFFLLVILMASAFVTNTPFKERVREELDARFSIVRQQKFHPADYFSGIQFRILSWRFVIEILNEKHAWILGVSPGDYQNLLDEKYTRENMFIGGSPGNKTGFLGYHSHNQFLQAVLETGLFGLAFFAMTCAGLIRLAINSARRSLIVFVVLLLCNCFTDAPLKTQYGIILFVFFPLFMYKGTHQEPF
jgi:O-antigen ligase